MKKLLLLFFICVKLIGSVWGQTATLVKDIYPLSGSGISLNGVDVMVSLGKSVVFSADNSTNGNELWVSDGSESNTKLIKDIYPGDRNKSSFPDYYSVHNGIAIFQATDESGTTKLYRTDGTTTGTFQIWDRGYYSSSLLSYYRQTFSIDTTFYFFTDYPQNNWVLVAKDLNGPGVRTILDKSLSSDIARLYITTQAAQVARFGNKWLFMGLSTKNKNTLYISDETQAGTKPVITLNASQSSHIITANTPSGKLGFFIDDDGINGEELWKTDGTPEGTKMVKNIAPGGISGASAFYFNYAVPARNGIIFFANDGVQGQEVWFSDGTENGTILLKEFKEGSGGSFPSLLTLTDDNQPYIYNEDTSELWRTDGTISGTRLITKIKSQSTSTPKSFFKKVGDELYCLSLVSVSLGYDRTTTYDIVKINTKTDIATIVGRINRQEQAINTAFAVTESALFYVDYTDDTGYELWKFPLCPHSAKINTPNGATFCPGSSVAISAEGSGGTGGYTYKWKSGNTDVGTNATLSVTKAGTYTVDVINQGCTVSSSVEITETTNLPVSVSGVSTVCAGTASPLSATVSGGVAPYTYQWKQAGGNIAGATTSTLSVTTTGVYSVSVADSHGCTGISSGFSVTAKSAPTPTITTATTSLTTGASAVLATAAASGQTYQWYKNKQSIAGATNNTYTATEAGEYTVSVTLDGCSGTSPSINLQMVTANEPTPSSLGLDVSPNPVQQSADVQLTLLKAAPATFTLMDARGRVIGEWKAPQTRTTHTLTMPMRTQSSGIYFLRVEAGGLQAIRRILKQ